MERHGRQQEELEMGRDVGRRLVARSFHFILIMVLTLNVIKVLSNLLPHVSGHYTLLWRRSRTTDMKYLRCEYSRILFLLKLIQWLQDPLQAHTKD